MCYKLLCVMEKVELSQEVEGCLNGGVWVGMCFTILNRKYRNKDLEEMRESAMCHSAVRTLSRIFQLEEGGLGRNGAIPSWLKPEVPVLIFHLFIFFSL